MIDDSPYWTSLRRELVQWFSDHAPSFVAAYVGAVRLLHDSSFPGRVHFICHVVRDIYRYLPRVIGAKSLPRSGEVFPEMVKHLYTLWEKFPPTRRGNSENADGDIPVSSQVYSYLEKIIRRSSQIKDQPTVGKHLVISLFRTLDLQDKVYIPPWVIESFDSEYDFFIKRTHLARSIDAVPTDEGLIEHFESFERALHSLVGSYFSGKEELDEILQDTNATAD